MVRPSPQPALALVPLSNADLVVPPGPPFGGRSLSQARAGGTAKLRVRRSANSSAFGDVADVVEALE